MTSPHATTLTSTPRASHLPGTAFATSFVTKFRKCPMQAWYTYWAPHPSGALGLEPPQVTLPLAVGGAVHAGLAVYQLSDRDLAAALLAATSHLHGISCADTTKALDESHKLLSTYHRHWDGHLLPVFHFPDGKPAVEHLLPAPIGFRDYTFCAILDTLVVQHDRIHVLEHKTTDARHVSSLIRQSAMDIQLTGQLWLAREHGLDPASLILNILIKRAAATSVPCIRQPVHRTDLDLEKFRLDIAATLAQADDAIGRYHGLQQQGSMPPVAAARQAFPAHGGQECAWCPYLDLCQFPEHAETFFANYQPRHIKE